MADDLARAERKIDKAIRKLEPPSKEADPYAFPTPCRVGLCGASGSFKTHFVTRYLCTYGLKQFDQLVWLCPSRAGLGVQGKLSLVEKTYGIYATFIHCDGGIPTEELQAVLDHGRKQGFSTAVVADDLMQLGRKEKKALESIFLHGRHSGVSIFELVQNVYDGSKSNRLSSTAFCLGDFAEKSQVARFAKEICATKAKAAELTRRYSRIVEADRHSCLIVVLNCESTKANPLRCRHGDMRVLIPELWSLG